MNENVLNFGGMPLVLKNRLSGEDDNLAKHRAQKNTVLGIQKSLNQKGSASVAL